MAKIILRPEDIEITHLKGSGPGGQNRNKRLTGIRMVHLPTKTVVLSTERRSQGQNLAAAYERMQEKLQRLFHRPKKRHETRRTRGSVERRIEAKRVQSTIKKSRGKFSRDSDY